MAVACFEAGADLVKVFPHNDQETAAVPRDLPGIPLVYVNSTGNDQGRGVYPVQQLQEWGWKVVYDSISATNAPFAAVRDFLVRFQPPATRTPGTPT